MGNNTSVRARALFDTGSHRTFITEKLSKILHLKPVSREVLNVTTFGSKQSERTEYKVVSPVLLAKSEHINVRALVSPTICPPISAKAKHKIQNYPEFTELDLVDSYQRDSSKYLEIDMLIGNDYYGHLVTGDMTKCNENGVVAVQSKFGWLLSGAVPSQDNLETEIK